MSDWPQVSLFLADPCGGASIADGWHKPLERFFRSLKDHLGENPTYYFWFYRHIYGCYFALDLTGEKDDCALTFIETDNLKSKSEGEVFSIGECLVFDSVDAVYLASYLVTKLKARPALARAERQGLVLQVRKVK